MINLIEQFDINSNLFTAEKNIIKFSEYKPIYFNTPTEIAPNGFVVRKHDLNKEWYIIGVYKNENDKNNQKEEDNKKYNNLDLLFSLLKLGNLISQTWYKEDQKDKDVQLNYLNEIITWCKKYGLPFHDKYIREYYTPSNAIESNIGFSIFDFKLHILKIFSKFNFWYGLTYNDISLIKMVDPYITKNNLTNNYIEKNKKLIPATFLTPELKTYYDKKTGNYKIKPYFDSLIKIAYFQFSMLILNKTDESLHFCNECGKLYIQHHGHEKNCDVCRSNLNRKYVKNKRDKLDKLAQEYLLTKYYNSELNIEDIYNIEKDEIKNIIGKSLVFNKTKVKKWLNRNKKEV